jgi:hypothetical protein
VPGTDGGPEPRFDDDELAGLLTSVGGSHARRLSPVEVGALLRREKDRGVPVGRLTAELGLAPGSSVVGWFLRLPDLPEEIQTLVRFGRPAAGLSLTQAAEVARLAPDAEAMRRMALRAVEDGLTAAETRSAVQIAKRRGIGVPEAVSEVLAGRDVVVRRHVWIGTLTPSAAGRLPAGAAERTGELSRVVRAAGVEHVSAAAGPARFTVVLDNRQSDAAAAAGIDADALEKKVNAALEAQP